MKALVNCWHGFHAPGHRQRQQHLCFIKRRGERLDPALATGRRKPSATLGLSAGLVHVMILGTVSKCVSVVGGVRRIHGGRGGGGKWEGVGRVKWIVSKSNMF